MADLAPPRAARLSAAPRPRVRLEVSPERADRIVEAIAVLALVATIAAASLHLI